ncbi:MAG: hypothetical protein Q9170_001984 [Blastenia crenularia]
MAGIFPRFFHLPLEIRQHVFEWYFSSLNWVYPHFHAPPILLASRQLHNEAKPYYWRNAHLEFSSTKQLLDFLTQIDNTTLTHLRHISVHGYPLPVYQNPDNPDSPSFYTTYFFEYILPLFPGLQLSNLRVRSPWHGEGVDEDSWGHEAAYHSVATFIESQGFNRLIYIVAHDRFMKPVEWTTSHHGTTEVKTSERQPQPSTWDAMLKARDGADSGASVTMYRVLDNGTRRVPLETEFETVHPESESITEGHIEVEVERGRDVDYVQRGEHIGPFAQQLSHLFKELTWKQILEKDLYVDPEPDPTAHL